MESQEVVGLCYWQVLLAFEGQPSAAAQCEGVALVIHSITAMQFTLSEVLGLISPHPGTALI